jgi:hypothetical protein
LYQKESTVDIHFRADALQYFYTALNLRTFGIYSNEPPREDGRKPSTITGITITRLNPGYPLFIKLHMLDGDTRSEQVLVRLLNTQIVLGALVVVMIFIMARFSLSLLWAAFAAMLTAICPHLIALEGYMLTETLFVFVTVLAALAIIMSWKCNLYHLTFVAGLLLVLSTRIRSVNLLIILFLIPLYFFHSRQPGFNSRKVCTIHIICLVCGYLAMSSLFTLFHKNASEGVKTVDVEGSPVAAQSAWNSMLSGAYPGFFAPGGKYWNEAAWRKDPEFEKMVHDKSYAIRVLTQRFLNQPLSYILWYGGGKMLFTWKWDNVYTGDVYIYPMTRKGFKVNPFLYILHRLMYWLHWPLFLLALSAPVLLFLSWRRGNFSPGLKSLHVPVLYFMYGLVMLTILQPLPRYSIPLRPFAYILSAAACAWIYSCLQCKMKNEK